MEPTENHVFGAMADDGADPKSSARGMKKTRIDQAQLVENLMQSGFNGYPHVPNLNHQKLQPHLMIMSTGRCGTMSLYRLLQQTQYEAHHQHFFNVNYIHRLEQMCRHIEGNYQQNHVVGFWLSTRAAEWLSAIKQDRPMATCSHVDTIFAPAFAMLHQEARVVFLRRNPRDVFASMYGKGQWADQQLRPIFYQFDENGNWSWKDQGLDIIDQIVWYLKFTDAFSRALGALIPNRWIEIDADKLFQQDVSEVSRLRDFAELEISLDEMVDHYGTAFNKKAHKLVIGAKTAHLHKGGNINLEEGMKIFEELYGKV
jgi:hypothetical protein